MFYCYKMDEKGKGLGWLCPGAEIPFSINRSQTVTAAAYRDGRQIGEIKSKRF